MSFIALLSQPRIIALWVSAQNLFQGALHLVIPRQEDPVILSAGLQWIQRGSVADAPASASAERVSRESPQLQPNCLPTPSKGRAFIIEGGNIICCIPGFRRNMASPRTDAGCGAPRVGMKDAGAPKPKLKLCWRFSDWHAQNLPSFSDLANNQPSGGWGKPMNCIWL